MTPEYTLLVGWDTHASGEESFDPLRYADAVQTRSFGIEDVTVAGLEGRRLVFSYFEEGSGLPRRYPRFIKAITDIVTAGDSVFIFSFKAAAEDFDAALPIYEKIVSRVRIASS